MSAATFIYDVVEVEASMLESGNVWLWVGDDALVGPPEVLAEVLADAARAVAALGDERPALRLIEGDGEVRAGTGPVDVEVHRLLIDVSLRRVPEMCGVNGTPRPLPPARPVPPPKPPPPPEK